MIGVWLLFGLLALLPILCLACAIRAWKANRAFPCALWFAFTIATFLVSYNFISQTLYKAQQLQGY
jgi:hypothetical protein